MHYIATIHADTINCVIFFIRKMLTAMISLATPFHMLKDNEIKQFEEYRTRRLVLES